MKFYPKLISKPLNDSILQNFQVRRITPQMQTLFPAYDFIVRLPIFALSSLCAGSSSHAVAFGENFFFFFLKLRLSGHSFCVWFLFVLSLKLSQLQRLKSEKKFKVPIKKLP